MSSSARAPSRSDSRGHVHFFARGKIAKKTLKYFSIKFWRKRCGTRKWERILATTAKNWNVNVLLHNTLQRTLSCVKNLEDSQKHHDLELECRRSAHQRAAKNLVVGKTLKTTTNTTTTRNWIVDDLFDRREKNSEETLKNKTATKCRNVSDRLDEPKLRDNVRWHFHQLLRRLRLPENRARTAG